MRAESPSRSNALSASGPLPKIPTTAMQMNRTQATAANPAAASLRVMLRNGLSIEPALSGLSIRLAPVQIMLQRGQCPDQMHTGVENVKHGLVVFAGQTLPHQIPPHGSTELADTTVICRLESHAALGHSLRKRGTTVRGEARRICHGIVHRIVGVTRIKPARLRGRRRAHRPNSRGRVVEAEADSDQASV